ncbi:hypothetical protein N9V31_01565, partial [Candidatus Poseidonia alphae]|nr:hypothetical protein [Candidatus Poseidonia alphae]
MVLSALPGVSERMAKTMTEHFGSEEAVVSTLESGDVGRLAEVEGLSVKRALSLARSFAGDAGQFLATKEAVRLHQQLMAHLQSFAACAASRERMSLLTPIAQPERRQEYVRAAMKLSNEWLVQQQQAWSSLTRLRDVNERYERVVVSHEPMDELKKYCRVLQPGENETWKDYTVFKTVTWVGKGAPMETPDGWLVLGQPSEPSLLVPERTIDWFNINRKTLNTLCTLIDEFNQGDYASNHALSGLSESLDELVELPQALDALGDGSKIEEVERIKDNLWKEA